MDMDFLMTPIQRTDEALNMITNFACIFEPLGVMASRYLLEWIFCHEIKNCNQKLNKSIPRIQIHPTRLKFSFKLDTNTRILTWR